MERPEIKVLLIEDDEDDYILVRDMLSEIEGRKYKLDWVTTYQEGMEAILKGIHDVYLLDYRLGDRDGLEFLKEAEIRDGNEPIIFLTGAGDYSIDLAGMEMGASDYLVKDEITPNLLERSIRYAMNWRRTEKELIQSQKQLKNLSAKLIEAQEEERRKISQEIHDSLGQFLTSIPFALEQSLMKLEAGHHIEECKKSVQHIVNMVNQMEVEVQQIQKQIRPPLLDIFGVIETIKWYAEEFDTLYTSIDVSLDLDADETEIPDGLKITIFRVIQEALNNVAKHSKGSRATISLNRQQNKIELIIQDNGEGFSLEEYFSNTHLKQGIGLVSMRERVEQTGGEFYFSSKIGEGTTIRGVWQVDAEQDESG